MNSETFALTQLATTRCSSVLDTLRLPTLRKQSTPLPRAMSTARLHAKSLLESINREVKEKVGLLKPGELLLRMKTLERTPVIQEKLSEMQTEVMMKKRQFNWMIAQRNSKAQLLASLHQELRSLLSPSPVPASTQQQLQTHLSQVEADLEREEHYTLVLRYMRDCKARELLYVRKPVAALHLQAQVLSHRHSLTTIRNEQCAATIQTLKREQSVIALQTASQRHKRQQTIARTLEDTKHRSEYEECREKYRYFSANMQKLHENQRSIVQLERAEERATALEIVAEEIHQQEAYNTRQEYSMDKLRKGAYVTTIEKVTDYYVYLRENEQKLRELSQHMAVKIDKSREEISRLTEELKAVERETAPTLGPSAVTLEHRLHCAKSRVEELQSLLSSKERSIAEVFDTLIRLLHMLTPSPLPSFSPLSTLSQLQSALISRM